MEYWRNNWIIFYNRNSINRTVNFGIIRIFVQNFQAFMIPWCVYICIINELRNVHNKVNNNTHHYIGTNRSECLLFTDLIMHDL